MEVSGVVDIHMWFILADALGVVWCLRLWLIVCRCEELRLMPSRWNGEFDTKSFLFSANRPPSCNLEPPTALHLQANLSLQLPPYKDVPIVSKRLFGERQLLMCWRSVFQARG